MGSTAQEKPSTRQTGANVNVQKERCQKSTIPDCSEHSVTIVLASYNGERPKTTGQIQPPWGTPTA